jgi:hypothetical protein
MNDAMSRASQNARGEAKYDRWRPFQIGFMLSMLPTLVREEPDDGVVDTVWFATGGGKTETYLGLIITSILLERTRGRKTGVTVWARFPLRMLSLQQTQRFANAVAAAEMVRRENKIPGTPISAKSCSSVGDVSSLSKACAPRRVSGHRNRILPTTSPC